MTDLLDVLNFDYAVRGPRGTPPRMLEFPVSPDAAPFLVSSTRSLIWVSRSSSQRTVRAAVRPSAGFYTEVVTHIQNAGTEFKWGNVQPFTTEGLKACVNYLTSFGLDSLQAIGNPGAWPENIDGKFRDNMPLSYGDWVPEGCVVFVPKDRGYLGFMGTVGPGRIVAVIHNPSRGFAIAVPAESFFDSSDVPSPPEAA